jgi:hypothetical protein
MAETTNDLSSPAAIAANMKERSEMFLLKEPEYRGHIIEALRKSGHWVAHWALPDHSTPEYRCPVPQPKVRYSGGFLCGPYKSKEEATEAAHCAVNNNLECDGAATPPAGCHDRRAGAAI